MYPEGMPLVWGWHWWLSSGWCSKHTNRRCGIAWHGGVHDDRHCYPPPPPAVLAFDVTLLRYRIQAFYERIQQSRRISALMHG